LACGAILVAALCGVAPAFAQVRQFDVPSEDAGKSIPEFARQAQIQIMAPGDQLHGVITPPIKGSYDVFAALDLMLKGTDLKVRRSAEGVVTISLPEVKKREEREDMSPKNSTSVLALVLGVLASNSAHAQSPQPATVQAPTIDSVEAVTVTGTSIRGLAPVGSNLISVGQQEIQAIAPATVQDVLVNIPSLTGMGNVNQGTTNSSSYAPTVHQLGASASNSTLVLIDGHRMPSDGQNHGLTDPNMIPILALQEVDVLPDGASSIYGSDAVAGVVNFITRRHFDGLMFTAQKSMADAYQSSEASILAGKDWESGSVMFAGSYSSKGALHNASRLDLANKDQRAKGGTNFNTFNCFPATIQPNGTGNIYLSAAATTSVANTAANSPCYRTDGDFLSPERRVSLMVKGEQQIGRVNLKLDLLYATRTTNTTSGLGVATATVFGTGAQANPFYVNPPGVTATRQTVRVDLAGLLPPDQYQTITQSGNQVGYVNFVADYNIDDNFHFTASGVVGSDRLFSSSYGALCSACLNLALNGTTNSSGSTAPIVSIGQPTSSTSVTMLPLTAANALDIWNPLATNRTSKEVLASLTQGVSQSNTYDQLADFRVQLDGALFDLPGGPVRVAIGGESTATGEKVITFGAGTTGPSATSATASHFEYPRTVYAAYAEIAIPIIGPDNALPFVQGFDVDLSGRYDDYSDVGTTSNPKIAANWQVNDDVKFRGTYSTSFVAPALDSIGKPPGYQGNSAAFNVPVAAYPNVVQLGVPGCSAGATTCAIPSSFQGVILSGATDLVPAKGRSWSVGADFTPTFLPGLVLNATLFHAKFIGGVTSPNMSAATGAASLNSLLTFYPGGATPAQVQAFIANSGGNTTNAPVTGALPSPIYYTWDFRQRNVLNLSIEGLDLYAQYTFDTNFGTFTVSDSLTQFLEYDQQLGAGGKTFSVYNTVGFNQTFPSIALTSRAALNWVYEGITAQVAANFTGSYKNWSSTSLVPITSDQFGNPSGGGGDKVGSSTLIDLHLGYEFNTGNPLLGDDEVYVNVKNLFDSDAPFYNSTNGYNNYNWNPIGRMISIGVRGKW
jgi:iron complex outermembrane receptor protein